MTMEMILALGILVLMIVLIMSDKMPFWRTATACVFIAGCIGTFRPFNRLLPDSSIQAW